jgi:hypothetical protein
MYVEAAIAEWIFHQEKSTLKNARKGYGYCGFALASSSKHKRWTIPTQLAGKRQAM